MRSLAALMGVFAGRYGGGIDPSTVQTAAIAGSD
jgi:hypothetical protein